jgi:hypothetical protein
MVYIYRYRRLTAAEALLGREVVANLQLAGFDIVRRPVTSKSYSIHPASLHSGYSAIGGQLETSKYPPLDGLREQDCRLTS